MKTITANCRFAKHGPQGDRVDMCHKLYRVHKGFSVKGRNAVTGEPMAVELDGESTLCDGSCKGWMVISADGARWLASTLLAMERP